MTITIFENRKGLIHGDVTEKITSKYGGVLKIGEDRIIIAEKSSTSLPVLCEGQTGVVKAVFYGDDGREYQLFDVTLYAGVIVPPLIEYENLARDYKLVGVLTSRIEETTKALEELNAQKQEAVAALNKNPLKHLIE